MHDAADHTDIVFHELEQSTAFQPEQLRLFDCLDRCGARLGWEKAARGVDGRWYPWGNRFDPSLCNMGSSLKKGPSTQPLDAFPLDRSIYGVRGAAGNVRDWTATGLAKAEADERDLRIVRGGAFNLPAVITRTANRFWLAPNFVLNYVGFRLACTA